MTHSFARRIKGTTPYYNLIRRVAFPSTNAILRSLLILTTLGAGLSFFFAHGTIVSLLIGMVWGVIFLGIPSAVSNTILYLTIMKSDPLFYLRRCLAFSLFTITTWEIFLFTGAMISDVFPVFVFPDFAVIMGLFAVMPLRALTVFSMSRTNFMKRLMFTFIEPCSSALLGIFALGMPATRVAPSLLLASLTGLTFAFAMIAFVEHYGRMRIGFSPIRMFRAFLTDWLEADNRELESYLTELGVPTELNITAFAFRRRDAHSIKGLMLVSNFHPGPFLNVGSSCLPYLFQSVARKRLDAVAIVPHGVSGHELNLVSQEENARIIRCVFSNLDNIRFSPTATAVVRSKNEMATATSQIFDGSALVTMTTAPSDMEDLPTELAQRVIGLTKGRFRNVALVDAHNCLTGNALMSPEKISALEQASLLSLQDPSEATQFRIGVGHRKSQFHLKEGFGPGGVSVLAVEANSQLFAYISIDGNNMIKGLREEILGDLRTLGFADGEVLTSDTHMVNGIVSARLGYYPIGAAVPRMTLLTEIREACQDARANLEPCEVGVLSKQMRVTTLGSTSLKRVMNVVYETSKLTVMALFPMIIAVAAISLLFLV